MLVNRHCNLLLLSRADATDLALQHGLKTDITTLKKNSIATLSWATFFTCFLVAADLG